MVTPSTNKVLLWPKVFAGRLHLVKSRGVTLKGGGGYGSYGNGHTNRFQIPDGRGWGNRIAYGYGRGIYVKNERC